MMEKLTRERNRLAKQIYLNKNMTAQNSVMMANIFMSALYGGKWNEEPPCDLHHENESVKPSSDDGISIHTDSEGSKWVRVKVLDEDFFIAAKDYKEGGKNRFSWNKAVEIGTFSKKQEYLIAAYIDEINAKLKEIGGETLESFYWSSTEEGSSCAWCVNFRSGGFYYDNKRNYNGVRPCIKSKIIKGKILEYTK